MIKNFLGRPVRGPNFFDRERERAAIWRRLETDHLLMLAPRRVGKTSLLLRLTEEAPGKGCQAVYVSVGHAQSEVELVRALVDAMAAHDEAESAVRRVAKGPLKSFFRRTRRIGAGPITLELDTQHPDLDKRWSVLAEELAQAVERLGQRWLILVDELPIFVLKLLREDPSGERARSFLNWFRALRNPTSRSTELRWVIAGSIGLDTVVARRAMGDTINDLHLVAVGAFRTDTAHAFLSALGDSYGLHLDQAVRDRILERVGWPIPFYLQLVFSRLHDHCSDTSAAPSVEVVDTVVDTLLGPTFRAYFDYWRQRLTEELGQPDDEQAVALLSAASGVDGAGRDTLDAVLRTWISDAGPRDDQLRFLLDVLQNDGYLDEVDGRYRFRSALLRQYWARRVAR